MKISVVVLTVAKLCLVAVSSSSSGPACLTEGCDGTREYCDGSIGECRAANNDTECYNATIALFQDGCDPGYECIDDLCRVSAEPIDGRTCHIICSAGKFCENGTTECRGPKYEGECFNLATGQFEDGCDEGFFCSFNKCVDISLEDNDIGESSLEDNSVGESSLEDNSVGESSLEGSVGENSLEDNSVGENNHEGTLGSWSGTRARFDFWSYLSLPLVFCLVQTVVFM